MNLSIFRVPLGIGLNLEESGKKLQYDKRVIVKRRNNNPINKFPIAI